MLSRLKRFGVPVEDLVSVYVGYVRPTVEYASPVHGIHVVALVKSKLNR